MKKLINYLTAKIVIASLLLPAEDVLLRGLGLDSAASKEETSYTCVPAPAPPPPAQHSSAEGLPPLPLPVVPLRRTEKKNPPRPPVLIAKISTANKADWATNPTDAENLLKWMAKNLNVSFSDMILPDGQIPSDPKNIPVLYRTGHDAFSFTPKQRQQLRDYLLNGGTLILEACCGRRAFAESAVKELRGLIPEREPYILPPDHPLFHSYADIKSITFRPTALKAGAKNGDAAVIGIDIGCRTAVFFFRWDVSCGWDEQPDSDRHHCMGYSIETAKFLGANLMSYITSERSTAMPLSQALNFVDADKSHTDKLIIAQAKYHGIWKCREAGLPMLLSQFHDQTKIPVRYEKEEVALTSPHLFELPVIYLTGHQAFVFTPEERAALGKYIRQGGFVIAESCCGREGFAVSFQHEISQILNGSKLEKLPPSHQIFQYPNSIKDVQPLPALAAKINSRSRVTPELYGITIDGHLAVVFSPRGLSCGWEMAQCPYCKGIHARDARALGINILSYSMMQ